MLVATHHPCAHRTMPPIFERNQTHGEGIAAASAPAQDVGRHAESARHQRVSSFLPELEQRAGKLHPELAMAGCGIPVEGGSPA